MKAWKIDLSDYGTERFGQDGKPLRVPVCYSLQQILFHEGLGLNGLQVVERTQLVEKLRAAVAHVPRDQWVPDGTTVLLDSREYEWAKHAVETFTGATLEHVELLGRVINAQEVEVEEKGET